MKKEEFKPTVPEKFIGHIAFEKVLSKHADDDGIRGSICYALSVMFTIMFSDAKNHKSLIYADELFYGFLVAIIDDEEEMYSDDEKRIVQSFLNIFIETMRLDSTLEYVVMK